MDIGRAFTFFLDDPDWIKKVLLAALISLIPLVGSFMVLGYGLAVTRSVYQGVDTRLPEWDDLGGYLVRGILAWVGAIVWALPVVVIALCFGVGLALAGGSSDGGSAAVPIVLVLVIGIPLLLLSFVYFALAIPVPLARYAVREDFGAMFEFGPILREIRRGIGPLLIALVVWLVAATIVAPLGLLACFVGVYVTTALSYLMIGHAMGQAYRQIDLKGPSSRVEAF